MDYEFAGCDDVAAEYEKVRPPFEETQSPNLTRGLNLGKQVFYFQRRYPAEFAAARAFLGYPQYWSWRLSGVAATEFTAMGAHTDLWRPYEGRPSSMVDKLGWRRLFPTCARRGTRSGRSSLKSPRRRVLRRTCASSAARMTSNASLVPHLLTRNDPFTVISTGTWVIIMAVGGTGELDPKADMLANVDVRGKPTPTARFMGGREYAVLAGEAPADAEEADIARVIASGALALPAFSDQGGPFSARKGVIEGKAPAAPKARAALATLYSALMTAHMLRLLEAPGELIVEGGFTRSPAFAAVLARLMAGPPGCDRSGERRRCGGRGDARQLGRTPSTAAPRARARLGLGRPRKLSRSVGAGALDGDGRRPGARYATFRPPSRFTVVNNAGAHGGEPNVGSIDASIERGFDPYSGAARAAAVGPFSRSGYRRAGNNLDSRRTRSHARRLGRPCLERQPGASFLRIPRSVWRGAPTFSARSSARCSSAG